MILVTGVVPATEETTMSSSMPNNARHFALTIAIVLTVLMILYMPFSVSTMGGSVTQYGFVFSGPDTVNQAMGAASALGGQQGRDMARDMIHYAPDFVRLLIQLAVVWLVYFAAARTILRPGKNVAV